MTFLQERIHSASLPDHWKPHKLQRVFRVRRGQKNIGMQEDNLLSLSYGRIVQKDIDTSEGLLPESFETYQIVEPGNIVMRLTDLQNDKRSLRQGLVRERGIITSAYDALEVETGHDPAYWAYALLALDLAKYYYSLGGGVRQSIKFADFPNDWIAAPDTDTQKAIAAFLDRETARIDRLIEKKERLVALLLERERAELSHSFNQIEAPQYRVRHLGKLKNGSGFPIELQGNPSEAIAFYKVKHLKTHGLDAAINDADDTVSLETASNLGATVFPAGTIVFAKIGAALLLGRFSTLGREACIDNNMSAFMPNLRLIDPEYALLALTQCDMQTMVRPGAVPSMNTEAFYSHAVPLPEKNEQVALVKWFRKWRSKVLTFREKTLASVSSLKEKRAALITAAVTGQIDVREQPPAIAAKPDRRLDAVQDVM